MIQTLETAVMNLNVSPELYLFADGIHSAHRDQKNLGI